MIDSNQSIYDLPYRARIMMTASIDNQKTASCPILNTKLSSTNNLQNLKPMNSKSTSKITSNYTYSSGDLQPLQWLQQDTILSIAPLDNEEEFVPGKDDITSVTTSPVKVDVISECISEDSMSQNSTIADYYRYQAMRAAMANGNQNGGYRQHGYLSYSTGGVRPNNSGSQHGLCHSVNEYQKPPFSYTHIIFMAIETSPNKAMTVNDIYVWCETHFPYYTQAGVGWKNSLRHNLSINKSFKKISRDGRGGPGRGAYWVVEPRERNNLIDAIRRSPCSLGSFPFLSNAYPWGAGNCYSNNIFQSANTLNSNLTSLTATRSVVNNKLNSSTDLQSSSRGPLLRIGGQLTDASNLIRSNPVIQRLNDSSNIIELSKAPQIMSNTITLSTVPLIQFDQIKFESELTTLNESTDSNDVFSAQIDEEECRGKVFVIDDTPETNPELYQTYLDIIRGLMYNEIEKSNSSPSESNKDCLEHSKIKTNSNHKNNSKNSGVIEDIISQDIAPLTREVIKKHCSRNQKRKCKCTKFNNLTDSEDSVSSISNKEFSELSDTDFNFRINTGLQNQRKERKKMYLTKLKSLSNNRKASHSRNRINNILRAPHSDHVYALLQEFLAPANTSENQSSQNQNMDDKESFSSILADDKSMSIDLSQTSLSKRSMRKLQNQRKTTKQVYYSDSDMEYFNTANYENLSKQLFRHTSLITNAKRKSTKVFFSAKTLKENSQLNKKKMCRNYNYEDEEDDDEDDDDEERENRFYDKNDSNDEIIFDTGIYKTIKCEEFDETFLTGIDNNDKRKYNNYESSFLPMKQLRLAKDPNVKRKVGRPKKSEYNLITSRYQTDHRLNREKILNNKFKIKKKSTKKELKYLRECNSNKKIDTEISNKDEQVAINVLANLQRKSQRERINNMYNLSNFIERNNNSDSNTS